MADYIRTGLTYAAEYGTPLTILAALIAMGFRINQEYERGVIYRLGRLKGIKGPGVVWLIPFLERMVRLDIRVVTVTLQTQETVTRDGVPVQVNAVLWYKIADPKLAVNAVLDRNMAVIQAAETSLRDSIGQSSLDDLLKNRMQINAKLMELLADRGQEVGRGDRRGGDARSGHPRADAARPGPRGRGRARGQGPLIKAQGESDAAATLVDAARAIGEVPAALEIRRLQTLSEIGAEHNTTIVMTIPTEFTALASKLSKA